MAGANNVCTDMEAQSQYTFPSDRVQRSLTISPIGSHCARSGSAHSSKVSTGSIPAGMVQRTGIPLGVPAGVHPFPVGSTSCLAGVSTSCLAGVSEETKHGVSLPYSALRASVQPVRGPLNEMPPLQAKRTLSAGLIPKPSGLSCKMNLEADIPDHVDVISCVEDFVDMTRSRDCVVIDVRPFPQFSKRHIGGSVNICLPTTLLRRPNFTFTKMCQQLSEDERTRLAGAKTLIFYDSPLPNRSKTSAAVVGLMSKMQGSSQAGMYILGCAIEEVPECLLKDGVLPSKPCLKPGLKLPVLASDAPEWMRSALNEKGLWEAWDKLQVENKNNIKELEVVGFGQLGINRYNDILPYSHSLVTLPECKETYINGNWLTGSEIGAQAPTINGFKGFSQMLTSPVGRKGSTETKDIGGIVCLTACYEGGRERCYDYWSNDTSTPGLPTSGTGLPLGSPALELQNNLLSLPPLDTSIISPTTPTFSWSATSATSTAPSIVVTTPQWTPQKYEFIASNDQASAANIGDKFSTISEYHVTKHVVLRKLAVSPNKTVVQIHHITWPDHTTTCPLSILTLCKLRQMICDHDKSELPVIVHCSAGCGRTGVFVAVLEAIRELEASPHTATDPVPRIISALRRNRISIVQSIQQYVFIYECIAQWLQSGYGTLDWDAVQKWMDA